MSLPSVEVIRDRIESVPDEPIQMCLKACYLWAARISEVVGLATPGDVGTTARGPDARDIRLESFANEPVAIFNIKTAKRGGRTRYAALPLNYEPWARELADYFQEIEGDSVFPFTRQEMWKHSREAFGGLTYPIERYIIVKSGDELEAKKIMFVEAHTRYFRLHALRHLRATELVEYYGFDGFNLAIYGGWTLRTAAGVSSVMERYLSLGWQSYLPKLMRKR